MRRSWLIAVIVVALLAVVIWDRNEDDTFSLSGELYPQAPAMPAPVAEPVADLLTQFEQLLSEKAPAVLAALQSGITEGQIDDLETKHKIKLPPDLRQLYRWRNGSPRNSTLNAFPDHRFVPLDEALAEREGLREQVKNQNWLQRQAFARFAGHREAWLGLIVEPAGDGYFFDPNRKEAEGSFFFCFAEEGYYVFFPVFRNYLAAVVEGHKRGAFKFDNGGVETVDFARAETMWGRYGAANKRD